MQVTFVDKSEFWQDNPPLAVKMQGIIASVKSWGANYLDKSDPEGLAQYKTLDPDIVIIATPDFTHVDVAEEWLLRELPPEQILVEKPLTTSINEARRLFGITGANNNLILAFDHYRARLLPSRDQLGAVLNFLNGGLRRIDFYFLEDHSGGDESYLENNPKATRNGPIENEQREKTLSQGLILDGMPHAIAILAHFCRVETLLVTRVRAGQYVGVDDDPDKRASIERETFAETGFVCSDHAGNPVEGAVYLGKGVRGVKAFGSEYDYNTKMLEIEGLNGNTVRFDLRSSGEGSSKGYLIDRQGSIQLEFPLHRWPYQVLLEKMFNGDYLEEPRLALNIEVGKRILELMEDMKYPIPQKVDIATYPSGMKGVRQSLYLEEIVQRVPCIYGPREAMRRASA
jgi:predicted dehydrogenase